MLERSDDDGGGVLVVVDGVFSMEGDLAPLPDIVALCREHGARLMVDEAHGVGVLGATGTGACEAFGVADDVDLRMGTFSKSLASCGGFIAGPGRGDRLPARPVARLHVHRLGRAGGRRRRARRAADHPLRRGPRAAGAGARQRPLPARGPRRAAASTWCSRRTMPDGSELITPIVPVTIGDDWQAVLFWKALYDAGVYANVALYPAVPRGGALLRTSVMATHEREHLDRALEAFERVVSSWRLSRRRRLKDRGDCALTCASRTGRFATCQWSAGLMPHSSCRWPRELEQLEQLCRTAERVGHRCAVPGAGRRPARRPRTPSSASPWGRGARRAPPGGGSPRPSRGVRCVLMVIACRMWASLVTFYRVCMVYRSTG